MSKIVAKEHLSDNVVKLEIEAPEIARKRKAGHFVIVRHGNKGERVPLTIADADTEKGTITLIIQVVGVSSAKLTKLEPGDSIVDLAGPLGNPTEITKNKTILCAGGGVGIAPLYPIVKTLKENGNRILSVLAARSKELLILEEEIKKYSDKTTIMTDDGSYGEKGLVTKGMETFIKNEQIDQAVVIGPAIMMKYASILTHQYSIETLASLNSIMVDGTGMCAGCRVSVGGESKFVCVDGPEFDAHQVDFDELLLRLNTYKQDEKEKYEAYCAK
jgi:ferredoxin/flavodoxin---NADP+ reductase